MMIEKRLVTLGTRWNLRVIHLCRLFFPMLRYSPSYVATLVQDAELIYQLLQAPANRCLNRFSFTGEFCDLLSAVLTSIHNHKTLTLLCLDLD